MDKLLIIIFSYNRALQLNTLLKSIQKYFIRFNIDIKVLYNNDDEFFEGYKLLKKKHQSLNVDFIKEQNVSGHTPLKTFRKRFNLLRYIKYPFLRKPRSNFRELLNDMIAQSDSKNILFLTDDSVFVRKIEINKGILQDISNRPSEISYSLRLGADFIGFPYESIKNKKTFHWDYYSNSSSKDWKYPFSVDGHIYNKKFIEGILNEIIYVNPNSLESFVCKYIMSKKYLSQGHANQRTSMLSFPINMVQSIIENEHKDVSVKLLETYFLDGFELLYPTPSIIDTFQQYVDHIILKKGNQEIELRIQ